jgi:hypothetical protein
MTREELIRMALEAGFTDDEFAWHDYMFDHFANLVAAAEREAILHLALLHGAPWHFQEAIRARGQA